MCSSDLEQVIEIGSALMDTQHFIVKDLRLIASKAGSAISDLIVTAPADVIASCAKTSPILASVQVGKGRVIALVGRTFINDNLDTNTFNNYELLKNILTWLVAE